MKSSLVLCFSAFSSFTLIRAVDRAFSEWYKCVCRGTRIDNYLRGLPQNPGNAVVPEESPWDGTLIPELTRYGYTYFADNDECRFRSEMGMGVAFAAQGLNPNSAGEDGPNQCFTVVHGDRENDLQTFEYQTTVVNGITYKATGAANSIGVNPDAGILFLVNIESPSFAFQQLYRRKPIGDDLPPLRAVSDIAWGVWNRVVGEAGKNRINALWVTKSVNLQTAEIVNRVFNTYTPPPGQPKVNGPQVWPGTEFSMDTTEGKAILGSENGITSGYFLAQHKRQFGSNKMIEKVTIWKDEESSQIFNMIFWVKDAPPVPSQHSLVLRATPKPPKAGVGASAKNPKSQGAATTKGSQATGSAGANFLNTPPSLTANMPRPGSSSAQSSTRTRASASTTLPRGSTAVVIVPITMVTSTSAKTSVKSNSASAQSSAPTGLGTSKYSSLGTLVTMTSPRVSGSASGSASGSISGSAKSSISSSGSAKSSVSSSASAKLSTTTGSAGSLETNIAEMNCLKDLEH